MRQRQRQPRRSQTASPIPSPGPLPQVTKHRLGAMGIANADPVQIREKASRTMLLSLLESTLFTAQLTSYVGFCIGRYTSCRNSSTDAQTPNSPHDRERCGEPTFVASTSNPYPPPTSNLRQTSHPHCKRESETFPTPNVGSSERRAMNKLHRRH